MTIKSDTGHSSKTMRATTATVKIGHTEFEGLLLGDGTFAVAVSQLIELLLLPPTFSLKRITLLPGIAPLSPKKVKTIHNHKSVICLSLLDLLKVVCTLNAIGLDGAVDLTNSIWGTSLVQHFLDGFGVTFDLEDRQDGGIHARAIKTKTARRGITDSISDYCKSPKVSNKYRCNVYSDASNVLHTALFNETAEKLREKRGLKDTERLRDSHQPEILTKIEEIECFASTLIDLGVEPIEAMQYAINGINYVYSLG